MMTHRGYAGRITTVDEAQNLIHGEVIGIKDIVTFQGKTACEIAQAFRDSVDDYICFCGERGESPQKPFTEAEIADAVRKAEAMAATARARLVTIVNIRTPGEREEVEYFASLTAAFAAWRAAEAAGPKDGTRGYRVDARSLNHGWVQVNTSLLGGNQP